MTAQRSLPFAGASRESRWTYRCGTPDRSGLARYTHLIRWGWDTDETMARGAGKRDSQHWRRAGSVEHFVEAIRTLMRDGHARTFHRMCVELTGTSADVWFEKQPDLALWRLVEVGELWWTCEEGATFFLHADAVERGATGEVGGSRLGCRDSLQRASR